ncbi:MAG: SRPBCC family protein [Gammaproteobacteria bacterium]
MNAAKPETPTERELVLTRVFDASRELVFRAWTDPEHLARWWGPQGFTNPVCELDPRPGGAIRIHMCAPDGTVYPMKGVFREIIAPERLVFTNIAVDVAGNHLIEGLTTVTFAEHDGKTKLTLQTRGVAVAPVAAQYLKGMETGWTQSLERLARHLTLNDAPLLIERTFNAPVARVWKAITDKKSMRRWYFDFEAFKPEPGFEFQFEAQDNDGVKWVHLCKVTEVVPGKMLAYTWRYQGQPGNSWVTFELFPEGDRTRLRLTHAGLESFPSVPAFARKNFEAGWTQIIGKNLKEFVETLG